MLSDRCPAVCLPGCDICVHVLWPNGWMDQYETWYGGRPRSRPHCVRWGPSSPSRKGAHQPPPLGRCLLWANGRPSQQLLSSFWDIRADRQIYTVSQKCHYFLSHYNWDIGELMLIIAQMLQRKYTIIRYFTFPASPSALGKIKLECGPMPNVMAALPNIGGALCSTPQSLADAHYST